MPRQQRYEQVADDLRRRIADGEFPPGAQLPSWADIGEEYQIGRSTVSKVMLLLRAAGLVSTLDGVGVFVVGKP
jgi:GntR family transcriptional regulator